jgi:DNA-directed RNA polymerase specialized sigma24 family protein
MIWRDAGATADGEIDPERELELRLVAQAHAGAAWALSSLVARYQPPVVRYLIRLTGDQEKAYGLAEQVFVRMARRVRGPHHGEHLRLWLLRTSTDLGLEVLRQPMGAVPAQLAAPRAPRALPPARARGGTVSRMLRAMSGRSRKTPRPVPPTQEFVWGEDPEDESREAYLTETLSPREQVRHRLIRAVLAELSYSDAQCLALHLVAGLNQTEVALALGVVAPVARRRIVQGLQLFGRRYEATLASLGLPKDFADADVANVQFTESGAVIARGVVPDETEVDEGESAEETALRREREVTGTLVVPTEALPALEQLMANEPDALAASAAGADDEMSPLAGNTAPPNPLDSLAASSVYLTEEPAEELDESLVAAASAGADLPVVAASAVHALDTETLPPPVDATGLAEISVPGFDEAQELAEFDAQRPEAPATPEEATSSAAQSGEHEAPARTVPVLAHAATIPGTARPTPPLAAPTVSRGGGETDENELLIEWGSNPQIPMHVRTDFNAVLAQQEAVTPNRHHDESDWLLVLEDERDEPSVGSLESRRRRILSADGEAEDPDESNW